jgi:hypothetical protein
MQITPYKLSIDPDEVQWLDDVLANEKDSVKKELAESIYEAISKTLENLHNPKGFREDHYDT